MLTEHSGPLRGGGVGTEEPDADTGLGGPGNHGPSRPNPTTPELEAGLSSVNQSFVWTARVSAGKEGITAFHWVLLNVPILWR